MEAPKTPISFPSLEPREFKTPHGYKTDKHYVYKTGEDCQEGDLVNYKGVSLVVQGAGSGGKNIKNPSLKFYGSHGQVVISKLDFVRRKPAPENNNDSPSSDVATKNPDVLVAVLQARMEPLKAEVTFLRGLLFGHKTDIVPDVEQDTEEEETSKVLQAHIVWLESELKMLRGEVEKRLAKQ
jgi:hypothetical protein